MKLHQSSFFDGGRRLQMTESIELTIQSLQAYGPDHPDWGIAWSGGKDSTATLTMIVWLIESGRIPRPRSLTVFYADTRQELPPLAIAAEQIMDELRERGIRVEIVTAPMDKRFMVYILGRGVPPPNNNTLRWCTRQIKIDPMQAALTERIAEFGGKFLMITGVRQGESAIRDARIEMSCGKDGAECGQGWYQKVLPAVAAAPFSGAAGAVKAPIGWLGYDLGANDDKSRWLRILEMDDAGRVLRFQVSDDGVTWVDV